MGCHLARPAICSNLRGLSDTRGRPLIGGDKSEVGLLLVEITARLRSGHPLGWWPAKKPVKILSQGLFCDQKRYHCLNRELREK